MRDLIRRLDRSVWPARILAALCLLVVLVVVVATFGCSLRGKSVPASQPQATDDTTHVDPLPPDNRVAKFSGPPPALDCVANGTPHIHVWLATATTPAGVTVAQVRQAMLNANGYVNEAAVPGTASLRVLCDSSGQLLVTPISVATVDANTVWTAVRDAGFDQGPTRQLVMVNQSSPGYYAGLGQIGSVGDSTYYAAVWQYPEGSLLLHELTHTLSAVQGTVHAPGAPNSTGAGHCRDGIAVECYNDGGPWGTQVLKCQLEVWDCNRDDYANPCPPAGTWLAAHPEFNLLGPQSTFIDINVQCSGGGGTTTTTTTVTTQPPTSTTTTTPPPTSLPAPTGFRVTIKTCTAIGVAWNAVTGASSYVVQRRRAGDSGVWVYLGRVPFPRSNTNWSISDTYTYRAAGVDSSGKQGAYGLSGPIVRAC